MGRHLTYPTPTCMECDCDIVRLDKQSPRRWTLLIKLLSWCVLVTLHLCSPEESRKASTIHAKDLIN